VFKVSTECSHPQIEDVIDAYEAVRSDRDDVDIAAFLPTGSHPDYDEIVVEMVRVDLEYSRCGSDGGGRRLDEYRRQFPDVFRKRECLERVAFEDFRLRRLAGEDIPASDYQDRFAIEVGSWPDLPVGEPPTMTPESHDAAPWYHELSRVDPESADQLVRVARRLPNVGDRFLDFDLVGELGHGAFGRVYLARQGDLANRFVALKITAQPTVEAQHLAQLQHTNIVPIYSLHRHDGLVATCMPFLGPHTLADALETFQLNRSLPESGKAFASTLEIRDTSTLVTVARKRNVSLPHDAHRELPRHTESLKRLDRMSYLDAAAWIMLRVADGMAHAHESGILHHDLKPANILLSDDGEPLLLDFNLSSQAAAAGEAAAFVGGTLPYMAPEHIEALHSGRTVDARSDVYALGMILFEMLTGQNAYPLRRGSFEQATSRMLENRQQPAPDVRKRNPHVSPGLAAIVGKRLAVEPTRRYDSARQLHEDLKRHVEHRPLRHAADRSVAERFRKWTRRHPLITSAGSITAMAAAVVLLLAVSWGLRGQQLARNRAMEAAGQFERELFQVRADLNLPFVNAASLDDAITLGEQALDRFDLPGNPRMDGQRQFELLRSEERHRLQNNIGEMYYLLASGKASQAARTNTRVPRQELYGEALRLNRIASDLSFTGQATRAILLQRARFCEAAKRSGEAERLRIRADRLPYHSAHDRYLLATEWAQQGRFSKAADLLSLLLRERPQDFRLWFGLGNCHLSMQEYAEAEGCFTTCVVLHPESALGFFFRGLSLLEGRKYLEACDDFDTVLRMIPGHVPALVNRALAYKGLGSPSRAIADLTTAIDSDATETRVFFIRARLRDLTGDAEGARRDRREGLQREPRDELSLIARGVARLDSEPEDALKDFRAALRLNRTSRPALQNVAHVLSERLGRTKEALDALDQLVDLNQSDASTVISRGVLLARLGKRREALADVATAHKTSSEPMIHYQTGCVYALTSKTEPSDADQAVGYVAQALKQQPSLVTTAMGDRDLLPLRDHGKFRELVSLVYSLEQFGDQPPQADGRSKQ